MILEARTTPRQTLFLRPRFNIVAVGAEMGVEVRAQQQDDKKTAVPTSFVPGREKAQA